MEDEVTESIELPPTASETTYHFYTEAEFYDEAANSSSYDGE